MSLSGIYVARYRDGREYVGSAVDLSKREANHRSKLAGGSHENYMMQDAARPYVADDWTFRVAEFCKLGQLCNRERHWIGKLSPAFNIATPAARKPQKEPATVIGFRIDDEVRAALDKRREAIGILTFSLSDTVREILMRDLRREKLL